VHGSHLNILEYHIRYAVTTTLHRGLDNDVCSTVNEFPSCRVIGFLTLFQDEVDPYKKPKELVQVSPKGLVPGLRFNNIMPPRSLNESTIIIEYLEECAQNPFSPFAFT